MSIERNERETKQRQREPRTGRAARSAQSPTFIRLHSDENPYGSSLRVQEIMGSSDLYGLPADRVCSDLRAALSRYTGFIPERIVAGAGTAELTERLLHAFLEPGDALITCPPSLPSHNAGASRARVTVVQVPRTPEGPHSAGFEIDSEAIITAMNRQSNIKMVALASPNNPTGNAA